MLGSYSARDRFCRSYSFRLVCVPLAVLAAASVAHAGLSYTLTDLGTLPGGSNSEPFAINDSGLIVGTAGIGTRNQAFIYGGGRAQAVPLPAGTSSEARGINGGVQIVGDYSSASGVPSNVVNAFLYSNSSVTVQTLPSLGGTQTLAYGINDAGQVVGYSTLSGNIGTHAFLYADGTMKDLGTLGGRDSLASAINQAGQVVGSAEPIGQGANGNLHAFLYTGGSMQDLGTLGGSSSQAKAVNDAGQVVGFSYLPGNALADAFLYTNGKMIDLGNFGGGSSGALGINDAGQVVGSAGAPGKGSRAFVSAGGAMYDLNGLVVNGAGYDLEAATGINSAGDIIVAATDPAGNYTSVLLMPNSLPPTPAAAPLPRAIWAVLAATPLSLLSRRVRRAIARG
jgi:probable HAF family extracellular repeat protein